MKVDTVVLGIAVLPGRHDTVNACLNETFDIPLPKDEVIKGYGGQGMVGLVADPALGPRWARAWWRPARWMEDPRWLRVQLSPWFPPHCRLLRRLLRLASARDPRGVIVEVPGVYVARFDVALTYAVNPSALVLQRPLATNFTRLEDRNGAMTWYAGARGGEVYVRLYDYAAYHGVPGPLARVEAEVHPSPQPQLRLLEARVEEDDPFGRADDGVGLHEPFRNVGLGALHAPDLDFAESALVGRAREVGIPWTRKHLAATSPADLARLDAALAKVAASRMLHSPSDWLRAAWVPLVENLNLGLLYAQEDEGEAVHWSRRRAEAEDDWGGRVTATPS